MAKKTDVKTTLATEEVAETVSPAPENPYTASFEKCKQDADAKLEELRTALRDKDLEKYNDCLTVLKKSVDDLNKVMCNMQYAEFLKAENPIIAAVQAFYVDVYKVKEDRAKESEAIVGVNLERKKSRVDLKKFCVFGELPLTWSYDASKLLALLSLREVDVYAIKPAELAKKSFYFAAQVRAKKEGETPDSNTQIVRLLQKIIDETVFVDDGTGKNRYKCTNHDMAFIQDAVTKLDTKEKCTIAMLNERQFETVIVSVLAHCLGEAYKVKPAKIRSEQQ